MPIRSTTPQSCSRVCTATNEGYGADSCRSGAARVFRRERGAAADPELVVDVREVRKAPQGKTAYTIARDLNKDAVPTAQGEARVRTLLMWGGVH